ncbi:MAG: type III-B CRISPR module-associated Cmr3 family protein [Sulfolobales archaeon]
MNEATLSFRMVESMMFRGPGEFDPFVRGTYSKALSLILPTPSTIAGVLATYCISKFNKSIPTVKSWIEEYLSILGNDVSIKGPMLLMDNEFFVEDKCLNSFLSFEELKEKCRMEYKRFNSIRKIDDLEDYIKLEKLKFKKKVLRDIRIGVGLQVRNGVKTVKEEGGLYSAEYLDYRSLASKKEQPIEVLADIKGKLVNELLEQHAIVKLGGETRIALMKCSKGNRILSEIREKLWHGKEKYRGIIALYLATPALLKGGEKVEEYIKKWMKKQNFEFKGILGESEVLGAGYSINKDRRKPIYTSLKP